ncbi:hypothetical protein HMI56_002616, partial [Coelomomyces lativittatus]
NFYATSESMPLHSFLTSDNLEVFIFLIDASIEGELLTKHQKILGHEAEFLLKLTRANLTVHATDTSEDENKPSKDVVTTPSLTTIATSLNPSSSSSSTDVVVAVVSPSTISTFATTGPQWTKALENVPAMVSFKSSKRSTPSKKSNTAVPTSTSSAKTHVVTQTVSASKVLLAPTATPLTDKASKSVTKTVPAVKRRKPAVKPKNVPENVATPVETVTSPSVSVSETCQNHPQDSHVSAVVPSTVVVSEPAVTTESTPLKNIEKPPRTRKTPQSRKSKSPPTEVVNSTVPSTTVLAPVKDTMAMEIDTRDLQALAPVLSPTPASTSIHADARTLVPTPAPTPVATHAPLVSLSMEPTSSKLVEPPVLTLATSVEVSPLKKKRPHEGIVPSHEKGSDELASKKHKSKSKKSKSSHEPTVTTNPETVVSSPIETSTVITAVSESVPPSAVTEVPAMSKKNKKKSKSTHAPTHVSPSTVVVSNHSDTQSVKPSDSSVVVPPTVTVVSSNTSKVTKSVETPSQMNPSPSSSSSSSSSSKQPSQKLSKSQLLLLQQLEAASQSDPLK